MQSDQRPQALSKQGKLVLLIGPSGVGKSVILRRLKKAHKTLHFPRSATTRERRPKEKDDLYHFVTDAEFDALIRDDKVIEWATVHGGARYGTLVDEIIPFIRKGKTVVREVDVQGFESIRRHVLFNIEEKKAPYRLQSIFLAPENQNQLVAHIKKRAPISDDELQRRIHSMEKELAYAELCDHVVKNPEGKLDETYGKVESLVLEK